MKRGVFDEVARDYVQIHDRSLPPGVSSDEFVVQKAAKVLDWITEGCGEKGFCYLDFGCGNGRLFKYILGSEPLKPLLADGRLQLFGFDTSVESIREARTIAGDEAIGLVSDFGDLPAELRFDLVVSFNVFHHIAPAERPAAATALRHRMRPGARLVVWEHNPFNPFTRLLVKLCPFDDDARLLALGSARRLFSASGLRYRAHEYVNVLPPGWHRWKGLAVLDRKLCRLPVGSQYWVMFANHE
jgi:SAM-dependent methyltransferase